MKCLTKNRLDLHFLDLTYIIGLAAVAGLAELIDLDGHLQKVDGLKLATQDVECPENGEGVLLAELVALVKDVVHGVADDFYRGMQVLGVEELLGLLGECLVVTFKCCHNDYPPIIAAKNMRPKTKATQRVA